MSFDQAAVLNLFSNVTSNLLRLGVFETVNTHEPKSAPGTGVRASVWVQSITPAGRGSGLQATSGVVLLSIRIYSSFLQQPLDDIDPNILTAVMTVMNQYSGEFTFGDTVRDIDLLGMYGVSMNAQAGYVNIDGKMYRVMTVSLPVIVNDLYEQAA